MARVSERLLDVPEHSMHTSEAGGLDVAHPATLQGWPVALARLGDAAEGGRAGRLRRYWNWARSHFIRYVVGIQMIATSFRMPKSWLRIIGNQVGIRRYEVNSIRI